MATDQVIVQLKMSTPADLDRMFSIEDSLFQGFSQSGDGVVDGHDIGVQSGTFNIFIIKKGSWTSVVDRAVGFLKLRGALDGATIAKFHAKKERYEAVFPVGTRRFHL